MRAATRGSHFLLGTSAALTLALLSSCGGPSAVQPVKTRSYSKPGSVAPSPNGIEFPSDYRNWKVLTVAHRIDKQTVAVVLGNDVAIAAAGERNMDPWPDGTIIANVVWEQIPDSDWPNSITVDKFVRAEFMVKDLTSNTANDSGWGWARWTGEDLTPYGEDEDSDKECVACHSKVSDTDWVFANPVLLP